MNRPFRACSKAQGAVTGSDVGAATDSGGEAGAPAATQLPRRDLLCNLRSILRKLGKRVLVGDQVREGGAS